MAVVRFGIVLALVSSCFNSSRTSPLTFRRNFDTTDEQHTSYTHEDPEFVPDRAQEQGLESERRNGPFSRKRAANTAESASDRTHGRNDDEFHSGMLDTLYSSGSDAPGYVISCFGDNGISSGDVSDGGISGSSGDVSDMTVSSSGDITDVSSGSTDDTDLRTASPGDLTDYMTIDSSGDTTDGVTGGSNGAASDNIAVDFSGETTQETSGAVYSGQTIEVTNLDENKSDGVLSSGFTSGDIERTVTDVSSGFISGEAYDDSSTMDLTYETDIGASGETPDWISYAVISSGYSSGDTHGPSGMIDFLYETGSGSFGDRQEFMNGDTHDASGVIDFLYEAESGSSGDTQEVMNGETNDTSGVIDFLYEAESGSSGDTQEFMNGETNDTLGMIDFVYETEIGVSGDTHEFMTSGTRDASGVIDFLYEAESGASGDTRGFMTGDTHDASGMIGFVYEAESGASGDTQEEHGDAEWTSEIMSGEGEGISHRIDLVYETGSQASGEIYGHHNGQSRRRQKNSSLSSTFKEYMKGKTKYNSGDTNTGQKTQETKDHSQGTYVTTQNEGNDGDEVIGSGKSDGVTSTEEKYEFSNDRTQEIYIDETTSDRDTFDRNKRISLPPSDDESDDVASGGRAFD